MDVATRHNPGAQRYEITVDGELIGFADYRDLGKALEFPHTEIDRAWRGRGMGARLVGAALADVAASGTEVVPTCWYVAQYMREHPESVDAR
ncbi:MAG: GNAT family N-acetyltransferase [Acidimicrobiia bacterium]